MALVIPIIFIVVAGSLCEVAFKQAVSKKFQPPVQKIGHDIL